jgi:hypothetical protein
LRSHSCKGDCWRCEFEIACLEKPELRKSLGIDTAKALIIAERFLGGKFDASKAQDART